MNFKSLLFICLVLVTGCVSNVTPEPVIIPTVPPGVGDSSLFEDQAGLVAGVCFAAASDAAGQVFTLQDADELSSFYDAADASDLCRRPIRRPPLAEREAAFAGDAVVIGGWDAGSGCTAGHEVVRFERDDAARALMIEVRFITQGACGYALVRPLWLSLPGARGYAVTLTRVGDG